MIKFIITLFLILSFSTQLFAEENDTIFSPGKIGITAITDSGSWWIGGILHIREDIAVKPAFLLYKRETDRKDDRYNSEADEIGFEIGIYYFFNSTRNFSIYTGPSFEYFWCSSETTYSDGDKYKEKEYEYTLLIRLGAQYMLSERFGFFADIGFGYIRTIEKDKSPYSDDTETTSNRYRTNGGVIGAVFYFN